MKIKFIKTKVEAGNAKSYFFEVPDASFNWVPGQYTSLAFIENDESHDNKHWFTIASHPESNQIQITTRHTGSLFKNKLDSLKTDDKVTMTTPEGDFIWKESDKPIVLIAGGIGITPYHSMLSYKSDTNAHLIYVNRDKNYVFKEELEAINSNNPNLKISYLTGVVDRQLIESLEPNLYSSLVYLSGPEPMVESVGTELIQNGLSEENLVRDWFPGYDNTSF